MASNNLAHSTPRSSKNLTFKSIENPEKRYKESDKRLFQTSPEVNKVCTRCNKKNSRGQNYLQCKGCKLCFCNRCTELSKSAFDILISGELDDFKWSCKSCETMIPSLERLSEAIGDLSSETRREIDCIGK